MPAMTTFANNDKSEFAQSIEMMNLLYMTAREVEDYRHGNQWPTKFVFSLDEAAERRLSLWGIAFLQIPDRHISNFSYTWCLP